ncbi:Crp/Fnr family transcriptional regulator [Algoriphagus sp.]|uniref:Crp/Fnr family transcriptional regulator n=1 Tax=Algoriphagus sp. TaxID=1872435 RepID=UPI0026294B5D|nr:Crp/Fnr family transcriptional regulator [Algoriphagus sp.]
MSSDSPFHHLFEFFNQIHPLNSDSKKAIESISSIVTIAKNQDLQPIGATCKTIYFVKKGLARIYYYKDGIDVTEYFAFENDLIIRAESLFTGKPSQKAIQAVEQTEFVGISSDLLFGLFDTLPDLERLFRKITELAYVNTLNRIESIQFHPAEERYHRLLEENPEFIQRIPLKHIASYLGITQVSLSRIRGQKN